MDLAEVVAWMEANDQKSIGWPGDTFHGTVKRCGAKWSELVQRIRSRYIELKTKMTKDE